MKILYVTSEAAPFSASGGLGDVLGALPHAVSALNSDNCVSVILPLYGSLKEEHRIRLSKVCDLEFRLSWRKTGASIYQILEGGVKYYFIENHYYFDRKQLYGEYDDAERFAFFSTAVVEFMKQTGIVPDVLHANDWQSALAIVLLKTEYAHFERLAKVKTVYTIHNIEYQGKFNPYILGDVFGMDTAHYHLLEFDGCINLMKGAMMSADYITTVSPNYALELSYDYFAFGLSGIVNACSFKMSGIINGIDYAAFSPENGVDIAFPYSIKNLKEGKMKNKLALQRELGLPENPEVPLYVMITRLASQKGIDLLLHVLDEFLEENVQVVVLGTGEREYEDALRAVEERHQNMRALIRFDRALSKRMYAAADFFLMPSKSEPCGLAQMIACSYGTIPIVRSVGGLSDTILPYGESGGCGFRFDNYNAHELLFAMKRALLVYADRRAFTNLRRVAKGKSFTWENSAKEYLSIYKTLAN